MEIRLAVAGDLIEPQPTAANLAASRPRDRTRTAADTLRFRRPEDELFVVIAQSGISDRWR